MALETDLRVVEEAGPATRIYFVSSLLNPIGGTNDKEIQKVRNNEEERVDQYGKKHSSNGLTFPRNTPGRVQVAASPEVKPVPATPSPSLVELLCESICNISQVATFGGIMGTDDFKLVLFRSNETGSTLALPLLDLSAEAIRRHVAVSNSKFEDTEEVSTAKKGPSWDVGECSALPAGHSRGGLK